MQKKKFQTYWLKWKYIQYSMYKYCSVSGKGPVHGHKHGSLHWTERGWSPWCWNSLHNPTSVLRLKMLIIVCLGVHVNLLFPQVLVVYLSVCVFVLIWDPSRASCLCVCPEGSPSFRLHWGEAMCKDAVHPIRTTRYTAQTANPGFHCHKLYYIKLCTSHESLHALFSEHMTHIISRNSLLLDRVS